MKKFLITASALLLTTAAYAQNMDPQELAARVGIDQNLGSQLPMDLQFVDETGETVRLGDYFTDRPVILSLVYYECPMLCGVSTEGLISNLRILGLDPGHDFQIVTVSIDATESHEIAAGKKIEYLARLGRTDQAVADGWHTLTGDQAAIDELAEVVGFRYVYDEIADEYAHGAAIMVATPDGELSRYYYGIEYPARDLRLGLVEASNGAIGTLVDQVKLLCYRYDPVSGKYGFAIWAALRTAGVLTVLMLFGFIGLSLRRERVEPEALAGGAK
ncbi:MAG: SCO family protein [Acidobacteria bacterium]|nr:SCO family protein [Acidobacteriota bacterium]